MSVAASRDCTSSESMHLPSGASALADTCAKYARHSIRLLGQSWIEGSFATFDCFFTQYLFSSMTVLAVSSLLTGKDNAADRELFEEASDLLGQLRNAGSYLAREYCRHVDAMSTAIAQHVCKSRDSLVADIPDESTRPLGSAPSLADPESYDLGTMEGMTWTEPSLQSLLNQPGLDMRFLDTVDASEYPETFLWSINAG